MPFEGINIDVGDAVDPFAAIDESVYSLEVMELSFDPSKAGDAMLTVITQVVGDEEHTGHQIRDWCVLEGKGAKGGLYKLQQWCGAVGVDTGPPSEIDYDGFIGQVVEALVSKNPPQGEYGESNTIKSFV